jgi:hypothetical protein
MDQKIFDEVEQLNKSLQDAKKNYDILKGRESEVLKGLKADYNVETKTALWKHIQANDAELARIDTLIQEGYEDIKANYQW